MRIDRIELRNFRSFERLCKDTSPGINVFVGDNGTGKTAVLDALAVGVGSFFLGIDDKPTRVIHRDDVRLESGETGDAFELRPSYPTTLSFTGLVLGRSIEWSRSLEARNRKTTHRDASGLKTLVRSRVQEISSPGGEPLPLIAYHGTARLWLQRHTWTSTRGRRTLSRLDGYDNCLEAASDEKSFLDWLKAMEWRRFQEGREPIGLQVVREAIRGLVPGCRDLRYLAKRGETVVEMEGERSLPMRMLSDGFQAMLALTADLAWRCITLNPELGEAAATKTPGVVLVDEIDLHLHPNWQRRIIEDLRRTFPRVQFFLTTHSPFIVQSLRDGEVIPFSGPAHLEKAPYRRGVEEVAADVLGVKDVQRSQRFLEMESAARHLLALLEQGTTSGPAEITRARDRYRDLAARYNDDPAFLAVLRAEGALLGIRLEEASEEGTQ